jgi:hypothetical protein
LELSLTQKISVHQEVVMEDMGDESILLHIENEQYYGLDDVGNRMWQVITEAESLGAAIDVLAAEYDVPPEQLKPDVQELIEKWVEHELVEVSGA